MQDTRKLSDLAQAQIEELEAEGIRLTAADIVAINAAAWEVESPESRLLLSRGVPLETGTMHRLAWWERLIGRKAEGGVTLWPLTMHGADWFTRVGCRLPGSLLQTTALAYAMAHGREDGNALDIGPVKAALLLPAWRARLRCRQAELVEAVAQMINQDAQIEEPPDKLGKSITPGELSAYLVASCGNSPVVWERQVSIGYVHAMLAAIIAQNKADDKPCASDPKIRAERALGWLCELIRRKHRKDAANGE